MSIEYVLAIVLLLITGVIVFLAYKSGDVRRKFRAEAVWLFPEGDYCYGRFTLQDIEYNCKTFT